MRAVCIGVPAQKSGDGIGRAIVTDIGNREYFVSCMRAIALLLVGSSLAACGEGEPVRRGAEGSTGTGVDAAQAQVTPQQVPSWNLADLYVDAQTWQQEYAALDAELVQLDEWRDRLCTDAATLADAADLASRLGKRVMRLYVYAQLKADEDTREQANLARFQLAKQMYVRYGEAVAWMSPEILAAGGERIESFIATEPRLAVHAVMLRDSLRNAAHTLDASGERILSAARLPLSGAQTIYTQMSASDIPWPSLLIDSSEVRIDNQGYGLHRQNPDRAVRRQVFESFFGNLEAIRIRYRTNARLAGAGAGVRGADAQFCECARGRTVCRQPAGIDLRPPDRAGACGVAGAASLFPAARADAGC